MSFMPNFKIMGVGSFNNIIGRRRAQAAPVPHEAQVSVSVAVTVTVEETSSSVTVYDALLRCLQNPQKLDAMCLTGSSGH